MQSLIEKALARSSNPFLLRAQHVVFPQNERIADIQRYVWMLLLQPAFPAFAACAISVRTPAGGLQTKLPLEESQSRSVLPPGFNNLYWPSTSSKTSPVAPEGGRVPATIDRVKATSIV